MILLTSIPGKWKRLLNQFPQGETRPTGVQRIRDIVRPSILIYETIIEKNFDNNQIAKETWERELVIQITKESWQHLFIDVRKMTLSIKHRYFQYRLINRRLVTNVQRHKWNEEVSPLCTFCGSKQETVIHLLYECPKTKYLWTNFKKWLRYIL